MQDQTNENSNLPLGAVTKSPKPRTPKVQTSVKKNAPAPNIQFVGRRRVTNKKTGKIEWVLAEPSERINDGETIIKLPPAVEQRNGFYCEFAAQIIALFPDDYKIPTVKGVKQ